MGPGSRELGTNMFNFKVCIFFFKYPYSLYCPSTLLSMPFTNVIQKRKAEHIGIRKSEICINSLKKMNSWLKLIKRLRLFLYRGVLESWAKVCKYINRGFTFEVSSPNSFLFSSHQIKKRLKKQQQKTYIFPTNGLGFLMTFFLFLKLTKFCEIFCFVFRDNRLRNFMKCFVRNNSCEMQYFESFSWKIVCIKCPKSQIQCPKVVSKKNRRIWRNI